MKNHVRIPLVGTLLLLNLSALAQEEPPAEDAPPAEPSPGGDAPTDGATADSPEEAAQPAPEAADPIEAPPEEPAPAELPPPTPVTPAAPLAPRLQPTPDPPPVAPAPSSLTTSPPPSDVGPSASGAESSELPPTTSPPPSPVEKDEGTGSGLYLDGNLVGTYGVRSTHQWNQTCPEVVVDSDPSMNWSPSCKATTPLGLAMEGRLGFRFGVVGIEGFGLGAVDWSSGELSGEKPAVPLPDAASNMQVGRVGGGFGGGLRLMSNGFVRFSSRVGGGIMFRHVFSNVSSLDGSSTGYTAPIIKGDLSLTFGKFLNLGVLGWVEFSPEVKVTPNLSAAGGLTGVELNGPMVDAFQEALGEVTVFNGPQFFIGPYLGLHFGK